MVQKFRVGLALQPLATAMFASSPFTEGKPNGFLSYRRQIWTDTDPDRTGMLGFVFADGMGFERYVDHALDLKCVVMGKRVSVRVALGGRRNIQKKKNIKTH